MVKELKVAQLAGYSNTTGAKLGKCLDCSGTDTKLLAAIRAHRIQFSST
jgi:hypothetical protein